MIKLNCNTCDGIFNKDKLTVRFTKACPHKCPFCIEKTSNLESYNINLERMINNTLLLNKKEISISGGEPFICMDNLFTYIKAVKKEDNKIGVITSLPDSIEKDWDTFTEIMKVIDNLYISLNHYDNEKNNEIYKAFNNKISLFEKICSKWPDKINVSLNLIKGYIDNPEDLNKALGFIHKNKVKSMRINEIQHCSELYVNYKEVLPNLKLKSPYSHCCYTDLNLYQDMKVQLKRSCFIVEESQKASYSDILKLMIRKIFKMPIGGGGIKALGIDIPAYMYENGDIDTSWRGKVPED